MSEKSGKRVSGMEGGRLWWSERAGLWAGSSWAQATGEVSDTDAASLTGPFLFPGCYAAKLEPEGKAEAILSSPLSLCQ